MHSSIAIVIAIVATTMAGPLLRGNTIRAIEEIVAYPNGETYSTTYLTSTLGTLPTSTPVPKAPASSSNNGRVNIVDHPSAVEIAMRTAKYIEDHALHAVRTRTGFVSPKDALFSRMALFHTNAHRINSSVPALRWDQGLADNAQNWANGCMMDEEAGRPDGTGVNAAWSSSGLLNPSEFISDLWYNEEFHHFPWGQGNAVSSSGPAFEGYGHLSQLLWKSTRSFGCGIRNDCGGVWKSHALCYYSPPGNYLGEFSKVGQPNGGPTLRSNGR